MINLNRTSLILKLLPAYLLVVLMIGYFVIQTRSFWGGRQSQINERLGFLSLSESRKPSLPQTNYLLGDPSAIEVPAVGIKANIKPGKYNLNTKVWDISPVDAYFAEVTSRPNNFSGNTLIYAHNTDNLFGSLKRIKIGDKVLIYTKNNLIFEYRYREYEEVAPENMEIFRYQGKPQLTLMTCSGFLNSKRRLMYFDFLKVI
ncbi:MAG: hypothetical protein UU73_C0003G0215 [Candidatus Daviesbacteria bacterium GW2011_GWA1_41_61]|uniref:Sortase family protein n=1 Tax=Candidatus Daviesbacteria bacterium GW2011_GWA2_40_9 TaxID=1618424 RepID=A0A0G0U984_9BACT|nr:MAG: hypothetical protein UU26_C0003G0011 [Candidatus Daviesbacteria bacterium GW2011_GWC1_40_9]KKR83826.1 MAG: hypothetical protein UU29_C0001G0046 [Candidatus Daviesbacteria bacterium GW2011_GWA2_40_9]KKR93435.1 MAG: hypothetical protein UU44_C0002G0096 [Candidatus Daviesbacteria bacterium GW2011_GWB1_41_15]KKS15016.1 MAG: hypothetical protein UU73_C0003G0215 [Candidatus Daviesbacteria bacterium GW2011_GWA1_41_61]